MGLQRAGHDWVHRHTRKPLTVAIPSKITMGVSKIHWIGFIWKLINELGDLNIQQGKNLKKKRKSSQFSCDND